jgi:hypothetical protein
MARKTRKITPTEFNRSLERTSTWSTGVSFSRELLDQLDKDGWEVRAKAVK